MHAEVTSAPSRAAAPTGWPSLGGGSLRPRRLGLAGCAVLICVAGCQRGPEIVPVSGKVHFQGKPLETGTVMFQPDQGPLARGTIQPDGTFQLSTHENFDGCIVGPAQVRITCFGMPEGGAAAVDSAEEEVPTGVSRIPKRYTNFGTSGLRVDVRADSEPFVFELTDEPGRRFAR